MLTGWANSDPSVLPLLAAAPSADVKTETVLDTPHLSNGSYWYFTPEYSIGFSPNASVVQNECDSGVDGWNPNGGDQEHRLCWHMGSWGEAAGNGYTLQAGWSLGLTRWLNQPTADYTRAVFKQLPSLHKGSKTNAGTLARVLKVTTPAGGSLVVSVSDASSGACRVDGNKLFAFGAGACEVTVTSLKANGDTKTAKSRTYLVN